MDKPPKAERAWNREQVVTDAPEQRAEHERQLESDLASEPPHWNVGEMAEDSGDSGGPAELPTADLLEGEEGLSGHKHNPGGGERWASTKS